MDKELFAFEFHLNLSDQELVDAIHAFRIRGSIVPSSYFNALLARFEASLEIL